ncbi:MAG: succinyl-diaminopimelate desuccinylase [Hyphomonadaceae bacterium]|nr:succinyl-diaminopimelate desuccinylase [Hyphomonadaceae bacterium]
MPLTDPLPLAQALMRRRSITPHDDDVLAVLIEPLERMGFRVVRRRFGDVDNLYARLGDAAPNFCFAGHLDVVPVGDEAAWSVDPFGAEIRDGWLYGRGAADMKSAIAAMVAAVARRLEGAGPPPGSISFLITLDEEGPAINGTRRMLEALAQDGEKIDHCVVGEPTSVDLLGDTVKNGRRGSLNAVVTVEGRQGHVAYPKLAINPVGVLLDFAHHLRHRIFDGGAPGFDATNLEITTIDVGNGAHNVIPARATAKFNIRFNTNHTGEALLAWIEECRERTVRYARGATVTVDARVGAEPFFTAPGPFTDLVCAAVADATGRAPKLSTTGGTSDARFIKDYCPVAELGLQNATAHMVDERVRVDDVRALAGVYEATLNRYFAA